MQETSTILFKHFSLSAIRYFVLAGIPFLLFYKLFNTWFNKNKIQNRRANVKDFVREIGHSLQTTLVFAIIGYLALHSPIKNYTRLYTNINEFPGWWIWVSLIISLIIHDTYFYWMHRLLHHKKLFKLAHLVHHQSTNPSPWASYSFHFLEAWTEGAVLFVIIFLIPVHPLTVILFTIIGFIINVYGHLGYEIAPKQLRNSVLFEVLNTSVHHNVHHSKFKGNYGLYFRVWDRLMGTEHPDYVKEYDRIQQQRFGKPSVQVVNNRNETVSVNKKAA
ncbi:sterol desaturase family protein [Mucilaginibacter sp. CSA2-8R]|uniref:sterol desaturase family protein n=1 Tax=Mucilaginibacter sp. CSA2-8R TaxID=3141542 RepID=UPI00315CCE8C